MSMQNRTMSIRLRRRLKLFPGLWLNVSGSGVSVSVGAKGLTVNSGRGKTRTTASLPGSGLSYVSTAPTPTDAGKPTPKTRPLFWLLFVLAMACTWYALAL